MGKTVVLGCLGAVLLGFMVVGFGGCATYNGLISNEQGVSKSWSEIDNMLQRRADLIPNLVSTVKGYAKHEKEIFENVAEARSKLIGAQGVAAKGAAAGALNGALSRLLAIAERYPDLKANTNFNRLQEELAGTENRIAVARTRYNEAVERYNARIKRIPGVFFAGTMGMKAREYFKVETPEAKTVPKVEF